jgi:hypothetical protein
MPRWTPMLTSTHALHASHGVVYAATPFCALQKYLEAF